VQEKGNVVWRRISLHPGQRRRAKDLKTNLTIGGECGFDQKRTCWRSCSCLLSATWRKNYRLGPDIF
jgi:hypothetical protein